MVKKVIDATRNYMSDGVLLRQVVNKINELDLTRAVDRHAMNDIYESFCVNSKMQEVPENTTPATNHQYHC